MERYVCIHGHFYQPPRENPWLEAVELQDSAYPFHDWNDRITAECYAPNTVSRVLDSENRIITMVNNYSRMSFNFGPTLLAWMEVNSPETYQAILEADRASMQRFSGHGSALAQAHNHLILPLANRRDKYTQIIWGIRDFEHRFGRKPEGMWLPEAAVDVESLDIMAESGIAFTILAPHQADRVRALTDRSWVDASGGRIDPTMAYELRLPSGRSITIFFYDGPISRAVAFEGLLSNGERFANRLLSGFNDTRAWPQLVHIATDGETYGHHHKHGDMALAYATQYLEENHLARITNYGEYLEMYPPTHEVQIINDSSWSCVHGIERWRGDCGCNSGMRQGWQQAWRAPLRDAMNWLRDTLAPKYDEALRDLTGNPWAARNDYIDVILKRHSAEAQERFLSQHASRALSDDERIRVLKLLEMQRQTMLMFTSCGWFFDELSGIETVQIIQYAGRAIQLAKEVFGDNDLNGHGIETGFLERIEKAKSNIPSHKDGRQIYDQFVKPAMVDLPKVGAHYAVSSLFQPYQEKAKVYCYEVATEDYRAFETGNTRLVIGRATVSSDITTERDHLSFAVLHFGDHSLESGVRQFVNEESYQVMVQEVTEAFARADLARAIRLLDKHFEEMTYSLKLLFRDEQRKILNTILESNLSEAEAAFRQVYEQRAPLMRFLTEQGVPIPQALHTAAEFVLNTNLRRVFADEEMDLERISLLLDEANSWHVTLDSAGLSHVLTRTLENMMSRFRRERSALPLLANLARAVNLARTLPFEVDLWKVQNTYYEMMQQDCSEFATNCDIDDGITTEWIEHFSALGRELGMHVDNLEVSLMKPAHSVETLARQVTAERRIPSATYRLQFNSAFTFPDARTIIPYLRDLGITDCYASPLLKARADSDHGYDICDHNQLNPRLGGETEFAAFTQGLQANDLGLIIDVVPNHMGIGDESNIWWTDVLENGPSSTFAPYFDIDWHPASPELENKVLLPILEDQYGKILESGKLRLSYDNGSFTLSYYNTKLPVAPRTCSSVLAHNLPDMVKALGEDNEHVQEMRSILTAMSYLPAQTNLAPDKTAERNREKAVIKRRIAALYNTSPEARQAIDTAVEDFNGQAGDAASFNLLHQLLDQQAYRLAFWRVATEEINYRRFFDINDLAAISVERPEVFQATHQLIIRLLRAGQATGLRIDHIDGLWNPAQYLHKLQESYLTERVQALWDRPSKPDQIANAVARWCTANCQNSEAENATLPLYVIGEKILSDNETLPSGWPLFGTTGYDFLNAVNGLFVDSNNRKAMDRAYSNFIGTPIDFANLVNSTKKMIMLVSLASEVNALSLQLNRIVENNRWYRDFTLNSLTFAIREVIAALPVYRTYVNSDTESADNRDQFYVEAAIAEAKRRNPRTAESIFDFLGDTLLLRNTRDFSEDDKTRLLDFVMRFQQVTGPVMAKGVEDTAFYVYNRLISLNEVGGNPERFGVAPVDFHRQNAERQRQWPHSLITTATHDTKRGEDVRARIDVLSEIPDGWRAALTRWSRMNASKKSTVDGKPAPDRNDEYLLYQTLVGAWPMEPVSNEDFESFRERTAAYMLKATKEAKVHTSWVNPNAEYDAAVEKFVKQVLADINSPFMSDLRGFQQFVAYYGQFNSLAQLLLKLTSPGVPDMYQGTELWDLSLVDPDNRRPVDYQLRMSLLANIKDQEKTTGHNRGKLLQDLLANSHDGRIKLYTTYRTLNFRREHRQLFEQGQYLPLEASGEKARHVCAFARVTNDQAMLVVTPRLVEQLSEGQKHPPMGPKVWQETRLVLPHEQPNQKYVNILTAEELITEDHEGETTLPLSRLLSQFPVALLERARE
jgi:(1->4)-alpha-D-glucan 1-alpha-D-glucosylmutase